MHCIQNVDLTPFTTMRVGGPADYLFFPKTAEDLVQLICELRSRQVAWTILGGGSNMLISSAGFRGAAISTTEMNWVSKLGPETVRVGAGLKMPKLAGQMAALGLGGCEFMEGIPGTVGGAVVMNAGAHGTWISNILDRVQVLDLNKMEVLMLSPSELDFGYRSSRVNPQDFIVLEARLRLHNGQSTEKIQDKMKAYSRQRATSQPKGFSSGCIFKNPQQELGAGRIIDELGFKGNRIGGAEISVVHANFILNAQKATSSNVCQLIDHIQMKAWANRGVWLQPEIKMIGDFSEEEKIIFLHPKDRDKTDRIRLVAI